MNAEGTRIGTTCYYIVLSRRKREWRYERVGGEVS